MEEQILKIEKWAKEHPHQYGIVKGVYFSGCFALGAFIGYRIQGFRLLKPVGYDADGLLHAVTPKGKVFVAPKVQLNR